MHSTVDVGSAIRRIQGQTIESMQHVDTMVENIEHTTELAELSGGALGNILSLADSAASQVRSIAIAAEQQSSACNSVSTALVHVNSIAGKTSDAMHEALVAFVELTTQSRGLGELIGKMR